MMGFDPYAAAEMERAARMHHREQQARMGLDPNDPHHRSSPFPPDMYPPYPPHFNMPPGGGGPMNAGGGGRGGMPPSPSPPHRGSGSGRKERSSVEDVHASGRGRGTVKATGGRSKQSRPSQAPREGPPAIGSPTHAKSKTSLPPPPSMGAVDERDVKMHSNGAPARVGGGHHNGPAKGMGPGFGGARSGPPAATPVATAAAAGVGNRSLYPAE